MQHNFKIGDRVIVTPRLFGFKEPVTAVVTHVHKDGQYVNVLHEGDSPRDWWTAHVGRVAMNTAA